MPAFNEKNEEKKSKGAVAGQNASGMEKNPNMPQDSNFVGEVLDSIDSSEDEKAEKISEAEKATKATQAVQAVEAYQKGQVSEMSQGKLQDNVSQLQTGSSALQMGQELQKEVNKEQTKQQKAAEAAAQKAQEAAAEAEKKRLEEEEKRREVEATAKRKKIIADNSKKALKKEITGISINPLDIVQSSIPVYGTFHKGKLLWQGIKSMFS